MTAQEVSESEVRESHRFDLADYDAMVCQLAIRAGGNPRWIKDTDEYADGLLGLVLASKAFRSEKGYAFSTLAWHYIRGLIQRGHQTRFGKPGSQKRKSPEVLFSVIEDSQGWSPDITVSFDLESPEFAWEETERILSMLDDRHRRMVERRILGNMTLGEIAALESPPISKERVRQLLNQSYRMLAQMMA